MSPEALRLLISDFYHCLVAKRIEMVNLLPESIQSGLKAYYAIMRSASYKTLPPSDKIIIAKKIRYLSDILCLRVYGWNSGRLKLKLHRILIILF